MRKLAYGIALLAALVVAYLLPGAVAQSSTADWEKAAGGKMSFEVTSVKVERAPVYPLGSPIPAKELMHTNIPLDDSDRFTPDGGRFSATNVYLIRLITFAYKISPLESLYAIERMPNWNRSEEFEIQARGASDATKDQMRLMMQSLLADRFKLTVHWETREAPELGLVLANAKKPGPNLVPERPGSKCEPQNGDAAPCGDAGMKHLPDGESQLMARGVTLQQIADDFRMFPGINLDQRITDETGLGGKFDIVIAWVPEQPPGAQSEPPGPSFLDALKDQLGLKLIRTKGAQRFLVIDHIEQPTPN